MKIDTQGAVGLCRFIFHHDFRVEEQDVMPIQVLVWDAVCTLTTRERKAVLLRHGIGFRLPQMTFEGIAQHIGHGKLEHPTTQAGISHERARQIYSKALRKLRHPSRARILRRMLEDLGYLRTWDISSES